MNSKYRYYIFAPADGVSGGAELSHQLGRELVRGGYRRGCIMLTQNRWSKNRWMCQQI